MIVSRAVQFAENQKLDGLIFPGAPREVLNPSLFEAFSETLKIPVATALRSSAAALKTVSARRILLLTPFDASLNQLIRDFLEPIRHRRHLACRNFAPLYRRA